MPRNRLLEALVGKPIHGKLHLAVFQCTSEEACMASDSRFIAGVFMTGMAVGALLMKIRLMSVIRAVVFKELEEATFSRIQGEHSVSA